MKAAPAESSTPKQTLAWRILVTTVLVTPLAILAALDSTGAGHGDYLWAKVFFPWTMLSTEVFDVIIPHFIVVALFQVPAYGLLLAWVAMRGPGRLRAVSLALAGLHASAVVLCFLLPMEHFS